MNEDALNRLRIVMALQGQLAEHEDWLLRGVQKVVDDTALANGSRARVDVTKACVGPDEITWTGSYYDGDSADGAILTADFIQCVSDPGAWSAAHEPPKRRIRIP